MAGGQAYIAFPREGETIFGINSSRPKGEVQEILYFNSSSLQDAKHKCTYIEVDNNCNCTLPIIISKPCWAWGATSGANGKGVAAGTIWQNEYGGLKNEDAHQDHLVPIDYVRLCLERAETSQQALDIITQLLEQYGPNDTKFQASYLITDSKEAWILNTAGKLWVSQHVTSGFNGITQGLNIKKLDRFSNDFKEKSATCGLWQNNEDSGIITEEVLDTFSVTEMFDVLRDKQRNAFRDKSDEYPTQNSHVSSLSKDTLCCHWFTGTPDPSISVYKPFIFTSNAKVSPLTVCNDESDKFMHGLYKLHAAGSGGMSAAMLKEIESSCVAEVRQYIAGNSEANPELDELMKDCVEAEVKFYR